MYTEKCSKEEVENLLRKSPLSNKDMKAFFTVHTSYPEEDGTEFWYKTTVESYIDYYHRSFNRGHFPIGTVAIAKVFESDGEFQFTVKSLDSNSPDNWIVETDIPCELTGNRIISIDHVRKIIKRGEGPLRVADHGDRENLIRSEKGMYTVKRSVGSLVRDVFNKVKPSDPLEDHYYDLDQMTNLVELELFIGAYNIPKGTAVRFEEIRLDRLYGFKLNKKKFDRLIKRLIPHCRMSRKNAAKIEHEIMDQIYYREMERELEDYDMNMLDNG